jgi:lysophospholipase L1-like esterase
MRARTRIGCAVLAAAGLAAATAAAAQSARYVAMGSSFAAGPGIGRPADDPPDRCGRSADNYAHQLARRRGLELVDVSCGGAVTVSILGPWNGHAAQIEAVTPATRLVTVTIGGNDVGYMSGLTAASCRTLATRKADAEALAKCPAVSRPTEADFVRLAAAMNEIATEVHARAPKAKLVFVDYLAVLPATGTCAATPLSPADADASRETARRVVEITRRTSRERGAVVVSASALSVGHDVCGASPWMNGFPTPPGVAAYHPNLAGMTAVAAALERQLER